MFAHRTMTRVALPLAVAAGLGLGLACTSAASFVASPFAPAQAWAQGQASYNDGEYTAEGKGIGGRVPVTVTIEGGVITGVEVGDNSETQGIGSKAIEQLPALIVEANGTEGVDAVSGASVTSKAILTAVDDCLEQAGGSDAAESTETSDAKTDSTAETADSDWASQLSSMSLEELQALDTQVHFRIDNLSTGSDKTTTTEETDKSSKTTDPAAESKLCVVGTFVYDRDTYVVVRNDSDQAILNYTVSYVTFDSNGLVTTTDRDGYSSGKSEAANIMPGQTVIAGWYGAKDGSTYSAAVVTSVGYQDGTTWELDDISGWAKEAKSTFSVDGYKESVAALKDDAALATAEEPVALHDLTLVNRNQFSTKYDLDFTLGNYNDNGIADATIMTLQYDANGFAVSTNPNDSYAVNTRTTGGTVNVPAWDWGSYTTSLFCEPETTTVIGCVQEVTYTDGSTWQNPYYYQWLMYHLTFGIAAE